MKTIKSQYADYKAGDAFVAGHMGEWFNAHKSEMTKAQLVHIITIMENEFFLKEREEQDPIKFAKHLDMIFDDINEKILNQ